MMNFISRFQEEVKKNSLIQKSDRILVAFSGGKDSVCLLFLLHTLRENMDFDLAACHIHHGIRGKEADEDLKFCQELCREKSIPFFMQKVDAPAFSKENGFTLEEGARILRYGALESIAEKNGYNKIATAHNASDQAETVLFHLIRGSGLNGTCGIPVKRENIIRPLLAFHKEEILEFSQQFHLPFKEDSTNCDITYARNRLRHRILPEMEKINPSVEKALVRFSKISREETALTNFLCDEWERKNQIKCSAGRIPVKELSELNAQKALAPVFRCAVARMITDEKIVIDFQHLKAISALLKRPCTGKIIEISKDCYFTIEGNDLAFKQNETKPIHIDYQVKLPVGEASLPLPETYVKRSDKKRGIVENINKMHLTIHIANDKIEGDLFARNRKEGDTVRMGGMTRSLKKLFQEARLPASLRDRLPLICDEGGIVWIPYVGLCDRVRKSECGEIVTLQLCSPLFPEIS